MQTLNTKLRTLSVSTLTLLSLAICEQSRAATANDFAVATIPTVSTTPSIVSTQSFSTSPVVVATPSVDTMLTVPTTSSVATTPEVIATPSIAATPLVISSPTVATTPAVISSPTVATTPAIITTPSVATTPTIITTPTVATTPTIITPPSLSTIPTTTLPISAIPPLPQPVIIEDPLVTQIKATDRSDIEARINLMGKYARHYPVRFDNVHARRGAEAEIKDLLNVVNPIAQNPKATHNELVQGFKVNGMARNLDVGSNTTTNADIFIRRALKLEPKNPETNYWFGVLLTEGGGMKEGIPYLNKAAISKYSEAHLSLANAYLGLGKHLLALASLKKYQSLVPNDLRIPDMIEAVKQDKASIW
ncbi:MAG TPA: hypothetical protein VIH30_05260 [Aquirhabdus sp.]